MTLQSHLRRVLRQAAELQPASTSINVISNAGANPVGSLGANRTLSRAYCTVQNRVVSRSSSPPSSIASLIRPIASCDLLNRQQTCEFSSNPPSADQSLSTKSTSDPFTEASSDKGIFAKLWDRYSFEGQTKRIILGERLFRAAQSRANDM